VGDLPLMHESDALAYLSEEGGKFPECLEPWLIEGAQQRKHHQLLRPEVRRQFYDFQ
jgi:hypothetical protein